MDRANDETDKGDDSPPVTERLLCAGHGLSLTELPAHIAREVTKSSPSGQKRPRLRRVCCTPDPSLWLLLCADTPARGLPGPCSRRREAQCLSPRRGEDLALPPFPPWSWILGNLQLQGEVGGRWEEVTSSGTKRTKECA